MSILMKAKGLTKTYQMGEVPVYALRDVDIEIKKGEFLVFLGHSGSGKTTLLNILGGLDSATEGSLLFEETDMSELSDRQLTQFRRKNIGFIFQMYNLIPRLTARENVNLVTEISDDPMDSLEALRQVGLYERANHFPSQMSGGEQQRVAIARAIAKQPRMLFCDEPTGALDVKTGILVLDAIQKVNKTLGTTTIVISHNVSIAEMADRVVHLKDGRIERIDVNERQKTAQELEW